MKSDPSIPSSVEKSTFDKVSAPGLQQAKPVSKQLMCRHRGDADSCKDGDAGAIKSEVFNPTRYMPKRRNIKLVIAYSGSSYVGWQKAKPTHAARPSTPSIEQTLEESLTKILQYPVVLQAASRTDAKVHAEGQVVNFFMEKPYLPRTKKPGDTDLDKLKFVLNCMLPRDIAIVSAEEMPIDFHPTVDSIKKEYWYHICNAPMQLPFHRNTSWHFPYPLDLELMRNAALSLLGTHDFSTFCNSLKLSDRNPICHLEKIEISELPQKCVRIAICGDRFLYKMARNIAGTLAHIGCGKLGPSSIAEILNNKDRRHAGITAPGFGLTLKKVYYRKVPDDV